MTLEIVQAVLSIAAPLSVIVGIIIALVQLRNQNRLRQLEIVMKLYSSFGEQTFVRHYHRVTHWKYKTYADYRKQSDMDDDVSLLVVSVFFEHMGLLLKRNFAPIDLLDDLLSGPILDVWPKVRPIWIGLREEYNHPAWAEWFEFFHDAMVRRMAQLNVALAQKESA